MRRILLGLVIVGICAAGAQAQQPGQEPGWSLTVISTADACRADPAQVDLAAGYVAEWAQRNLPDPSRLTKEKALAHIKDNDEIKQIVAQKGAFIYPCSRWRKMLDMFVESKGSVMGGIEPKSEEKAEVHKATTGWRNREGACRFSRALDDGPVESVSVTFEKEGEPALELSFWVRAPGLAALGAKDKRNGCRFYGDVEGFAEVGGERFKAVNSASTACAVKGDKIGADSQSIDLIDLTDKKRIENVTRGLLAGDALVFTVTNPPKRGHKIELPTKGLKEAIREVAVCPAAVRNIAQN